MNNTKLKEKIEQMEKELAELKKAVKENDEPKFERTIGNTYYCINNLLRVADCSDNSKYDSTMYKIGNYFHTKQRAKEVAEKIKMLLKLERLHDIYCPNYIPNWDDKEKKFYIYYNHYKKMWEYSYDWYYMTANNAWFPSKEISQKVCDILNAEKENEDE